MVELLGADVRVALPNKVIILNKLGKVSTFLNKVANIAADNVELAEAVSEVSTSTTLYEDSSDLGSPDQRCCESCSWCHELCHQGILFLLDILA